MDFDEYAISRPCLYTGATSFEKKLKDGVIWQRQRAFG